MTNKKNIIEFRNKLIMLEDLREPFRIFQRESIYKDQYKGLGYSSKKELFNYIDKGVKLISTIMREAGDASELQLKGNFITDPKDPNAMEDLIKIEKSAEKITISITNPPNNNYELIGITFGFVQFQTESDPVYRQKIDGEFDRAPDWDMLAALEKKDLDRVYKILELVHAKELHKLKNIESVNQQEESKKIE